MNDEDAIRRLLDDPQQALRHWYVAVTPAANPDLVLTGGAGPSDNRIRVMFEGWVARRHGDLRVIICDNLGYGRISQNSKDLGEIALVAAVSSALTLSPWKDQIDPLATAAILVSTRMIDTLCLTDAPNDAGDHDKK